VKPAGENEEQNFPREPSSALEIMMTQYGTAVLRTAFFYLCDRHLAEDVSQEVFIRAYRNWSSYRGESSVKTWLTRITINLCRDKLGLKMSSEEPTDPALLHRDQRVSVEEEVMKRLSNSMILKHVLNLPVHYQEVLYLYYYLDLNTREIAEATESPEGTVRNRLHRGRELLGEYLTKEEEVDK
jgi:RNA polymerase sigma-70 factor (ECF subfamily)